MILDFYEFATAALDGQFGWQKEAAAIVFIVVVFNFFTKWMLRMLHQHFQKKKSIWKDSFVQALYSPLSVFTWFLAVVYTINLILSQIDVNIDFQNIHIVVGVAAILSLAWFALSWKKTLFKLTLH